MKLGRLIILMWLLLVLTFSTMEESSTFAQGEGWTAANGTYIGTIGLNGTYKIPPEKFPGAGAESEINWDGVATGPLEINIEGGFGVGTWKLDGDAIIDGALAQILIDGTQTISAGGELVGSFAQHSLLPLSLIIDLSSAQTDQLSTIVLTGNVSTEVTITTTVNGNTNTTTGSGAADDVNLLMYYQSASCTQIQGDWIQEPVARLEDAGILPNLTGGWAVVREDAIIGDEGVQELVEELLLESLEIRESANQCQLDGEQIDNFIRETHALLVNLQSDLSCGIPNDNSHYLYPITSSACSTLLSISSTPDSCLINDEGVSMDELQLISMSLAGLGCFGQDFFRENQDYFLENFELTLLTMLENLDLGDPHASTFATRIIVTAQNLGLDSVVTAVYDAYSNYSNPGGGE